MDPLEPDAARKVRDERRQGPMMEPVFSETEGDLFSHERVWVDGTELPVDSTQWVSPPYGVLIWLEETAYSATDGIDFEPRTDETHRFELENTEEPFWGEVHIHTSVSTGETFYLGSTGGRRMSTLQTSEALDVDWSNEPRWAKHRARYIQQTTEYDATEAVIIAWAELGFSHHGIAEFSELDVTRSTVKSRMDEITETSETVGALWARQPDSLVIRSPVGIEGTVWREVSDK
jgi:hypothetical protein